MTRWVRGNLQDLADAAVARSSRLRRFAAASSWAEAAAVTDGYESMTANKTADALRSWDRPKTRLDARELQAVAAFGTAIVALDSPTVRVVDVGGWDAHYSRAIRSSYPRVTFRWSVLETEGAANALEERPHPDWLEWSADADALFGREVDIAFASGALNYFEKPIPFLDRLMRVCEFVVLTRLPLWPIDAHRPAAQFVKRGSREGCPTWFFSDQLFRQHVKRAGGRIIAEWDVPQDSAFFAGLRCDYQGLVIDCRGERGS